MGWKALNPWSGNGPWAGSAPWTGESQWGTGTSGPPAPGEYGLLLETGDTDFLLLETGDFLVLET